MQGASTKLRVRPQSSNHFDSKRKFCDIALQPRKRSRIRYYKMSPQPGFEIREASLEDMEELWHVLMSAYGSDEVWVSIFKSVKAEEVHPWIMANLNPRWTMPDIKNYKVVELSTG